MGEEALRFELPWYRHHGARLIARNTANWGGVRVELLTRETDAPCSGAMCLPVHVVSFLVDGRRSGIINSIEDGTPRRVGQDTGWMRIVPAGRKINTQWDRGRRTYLLAFLEPEFLDAICRRNGVESTSDLQVHIDVRDQRLAHVLDDMSRELREPGLMSSELGAALAAQLCIQAIRLMRLRRAGAPMRRGGLSSHDLALVLDVIEQRLDRSIGVRELAFRVGLSPSHFTHAFRQSTGLPPHRYIVEQRLAAARRLLMNEPALKLTEVALQVGFAGSSQFAMAFRRATGLAPSEWRRVAKSAHLLTTDRK